MLGTEKRRKKVRFEMMADIGGGDVFEQLLPPNGGAVDQNIEPAELIERLLDCSFDSRFIGEIGPDGNRRCTLCAVTGDGFLRLLFCGVVMDGDGVTASGKGIRDKSADAPFAAAGD